MTVGLKIAAISDSHEQHRKLKLPDADILIYTGDYSYQGTEEVTIDFLKWLDEQEERYKEIIFIAGNHDWIWQRDPIAAKNLLKLYAPSVIYLENEEFIISHEDRDYKIYGSPITPNFFNWAFMKNRGEALKEHWAKIPDDVNVLLTHGPAYGILDKVRPHPANLGPHAGCYDLLKRIEELKELRCHFFGHIHDSSGITMREKTMFVNASVLNDNYKMTFPPKVVVI